ncbi:DUF523 domain-containing protein [Nitrospina gracilis]|nr:DUF523 domain-containing protein [Nitrospina gracilis]
MVSKIKVAVSSCLLGEKVRWNGEDKREAVLLDELTKLFEYISVCPEVELGMGVPREPVQLIGDKNEQKMQEVETGKDWAMVEFSETKILQLIEQGVCGFIFKSRSPSCGTKGIPIYNDKGEVLPEEVAGLFAQALMKHAPALPIIEENELRNKQAREKFISQVRCVDGDTS